MTAAFLRDAAATAAIFGFFASAWFGWAQDQPPPAWRKALVAGSILSLLTAAGGGVMTWQNWSGPTVFDRNCDDRSWLASRESLTCDEVVAYRPGRLKPRA
jgi:hypothetical protein